MRYGFKKIIAVVLVLSGIAVLIIALNVKKTPVEEGSNTVESTSEKITVDYDKDSDSDSLKDWEEALWKTDPEVADTDKDGTSDGEEVKVGRDPRVGGPKDTLQYNIGVKTEKGSEEIKKSEPKNTEVVVIPKPQGLSETQILKNYGNTVAILLKNFSKFTDELSVLQDVIQDTNDTNVERLLLIKSKYQSLAIALQSVPVPDKTKKVHNTLIEAEVSHIRAVETLMNSRENNKIPVESYVVYNNSGLLGARAIYSLAQFFKDEGVVFTVNEEGYIFSQIAGN